jgi:sensor histidine kinase YesM
MNKSKIEKKTNLVQLQYLVWAVVLLVSFFAMISTDGVERSAAFALMNTGFYSLIVYGNIRLLYPRYYQRGSYFLYILFSILLLLIAGICRGYLSLYIEDRGFSVSPRLLDASTHLRFFLWGITVFVLSFIFRLAIAYFTLKQQQEETMLQRSQFELRLLKAQVQPHFLFNTLNNMYYEAYMEAPRTALLIERLSDIMRYFVDQSSQDTVPLATEVQFLDNYIALEQIRISPEPEISFYKQFDPGTLIPPMLLMTFVENIFKHGIDKIRGGNRIELSLVQDGGYLHFSSKNTLNEHMGPIRPAGLGLENLRKRLAILYPGNFELNTFNDGERFTATLKVPLT